MRKLSIIFTALLGLSMLFSSCEKTEDTVRVLPDATYELSIDGRTFTPGFNSAIIDLPDQANPVGAMRITGVGYKEYIEEDGEINYSRYTQESIIIDLLGYKKGTYILDGGGGPNVMGYASVEYYNEDPVSNKILTNAELTAESTSYVEITAIDEVDQLISGFYEFYVEDGVNEDGTPYIAKFEGNFEYVRYTVKDLPF